MTFFPWPDVNCEEEVNWRFFSPLFFLVIVFIHFIKQDNCLINLIFILASPEPVSYPQTQQPVLTRAMPQQQRASGSGIGRSDSNTVYVPFEYTY